MRTTARLFVYGADRPPVLVCRAASSTDTKHMWRNMRPLRRIFSYAPSYSPLFFSATIILLSGYILSASLSLPPHVINPFARYRAVAINFFRNRECRVNGNNGSPRWNLTRELISVNFVASKVTSKISEGKHSVENEATLTICFPFREKLPHF